jgi:hypothetical protein
VSSVHGQRRLVDPRAVTRRYLSEDLRFRLYFRVLATPGLSELYVVGRKPLRPSLVTRQTDLVMDGFPRSANTYSRAAFDQVNRRRVSSHQHSPRAVERGLRLGVPCIVLSRDPRDAVASLLQWMPGVRTASALRYYTYYYTRLMPLRHQLIVASFEQVKNDFGTVIRRCNDHFGSDFVPYERTAENEAAVRSDIERLARATTSGSLCEESVARPSARRLSTDQALGMMGARDIDLLQEALGVWRSFLG